jgi:hypothetical protein
MTPLRQLQRIADGLAARLDAKAGFYLVMAGCLLFTSTAIRSSHRLFWYDELLTVNVAAQPDFAGVWRTLQAGLDLNPPFQYLAIRGSQALFGTGELATRLPALAGFLAMSLCIFLFLRKRLPASLALAGAFIAWLTPAYTYGYDARPYGIVLGWAGIALLCWSKAADAQRRGLALTGLGLSLAAALATHYYAVLLALPFGIGELVRLRARRRPDWAMWSVLAASSTMVLLYPQLLIRREPSPVYPWSPFHVSIWDVPASYRDLLAPLVLPILLGLLCTLALDRCTEAPREKMTAPAMHEWAAMAGFLAIPVFAVAIAALSTGAFNMRYGVAGVIGIACLVPHIAGRLARHPARHGAVLAVILLGAYTGDLALQFWEGAQPTVMPLWQTRPSGPPLEVPGHPLLDAVAGKHIPLVIADGQVFLQLDHYGDPALLARTYYLTDVEAAGRRTGSSEFERVYPRMKRAFHLRGNVEPAGQFLERKQPFLLYSTGYFVEWLPQELMARNWRVRVLAKLGSRTVSEVEAP